MEAESVYTPEFARRVMPQKEPMLFVDHVISVDEGELLSGTVSFTPGKRPCEGLLPDGSLAAPAVLESMAQSYALLRAAFNVIRGISDGPVAPGVFVSARSFELLWKGNFPAGEEIDVRRRGVSRGSHGGPREARGEERHLSRSPSIPAALRRQGSPDRGERLFS